MVRWMYKVDVYLRVRRAVMVEGKSIRSGAGVRTGPGHRAQDVGLLRAAGLPAADCAQEAQAGTIYRRH